MDEELMAKIARVSQGGPSGQKEEEDEVELEIVAREDGDHVVLSGPAGHEEHRLKALDALYVSDRERQRRPGTSEDPENMGLLMAIEGAIARCYRTRPDLKDWDVIRALERLDQKPAAVPETPLATAVHRSLRLELSLEDHSCQEVRRALRKVSRSVRRHYEARGTRGYLDFIVDYV